MFASFFFFSSRRRHTRLQGDWSSDVCSSDLSPDGSPRSRLPSGDGLFLLLDAQTGVPELLLEEHGYLTDLRTAAAVALTLRYLAPRDAKEALLVGAGALARIPARPMVAELPLQQLTAWNRPPERADWLARDVSSLVPTRV